MTNRDDPSNPYARPSVWPKMPQAPFRVGPLPKAEAPLAPAPRTLPPAPGPRSSIFTGSAVPVGAARPQPAPPSPPPPPPTETFEVPAAPEPAFAPEPRTRAPRRKGLADHVPLIGSAVVGLIGLAIAAMVFLRPAPAPAPPVETVHIPAAIATAPPVASAATPEIQPPAAGLRDPVQTAAVAPPRRALRRAAPLPAPQPEPTVAEAPAPVVAPPQPIVAPPVQAQPTPAPPPPSDPDAPISTREPLGQ